jgi:gliding motility-associated-like protein
MAATGPNNKTYTWSPKIFLSDTTIYNPIATPLVTTPFYLKVVSPDKCEAFDTVLITVKPFRLDIPNSFSPNGDGINDTWNLGELGLSSQARVTIYDRGCREVFTSNGYNLKWDGTRNGKPVPAGTYYYIIEPGFKFARHTGWVLLIR